MKYAEEDPFSRFVNENRPLKWQAQLDTNLTNPAMPAAKEFGATPRENEMSKMAKKVEAKYSIYVIELDKAILDNKKFMKENPGYVTGQPCVYVGMTVRTPEERFKQHKEGYKAAKFVKKFGLFLKPRQYHTLNPMTYDEACRMEVEKARRLRKRGYGVWQK